MAVQFSAVTVSADDNTTKLFVGGIPQSYDDLEGWRIFEDFLGELEQETKVHIQAQSYLYGAEEIYPATPEEVAYFMMRMEHNPSFCRIVAPREKPRNSNSHGRRKSYFIRRHCNYNPRTDAGWQQSESPKRRMLVV